MNSEILNRSLNQSQTTQVKVGTATVSIDRTILWSSSCHEVVGRREVIVTVNLPLDITTRCHEKHHDKYKQFPILFADSAILLTVALLPK